MLVAQLGQVAAPRVLEPLALCPFSPLALQPLRLPLLV